MTKEQLLKLIDEIPDGMEICVFDWKRNEIEDGGDEMGCSAGIYKDFEIYIMDKQCIPKGSKQYAVIAF